MNDQSSLNGYTLFSSNTTSYLVDNCGYIINQWESDNRPGQSLYLLENGNLLRTARINGSFAGGGIGGRLELFSWEGDVIWSYDYATNNHHQHHDIAPLPNGNILILAWDERSETAAIQSGRIPNNVDDNVWPEKIVEVEMVGDDEINVVWQWFLWDHLIQDFDATKDNYGVVADHPELIDINFESDNANEDWIHANAINYNPELDQILISSRVFSEVWVIDHSTTSFQAGGHTGGNAEMGGDILYRFGNPQSYQRGDESDQKFFGQHDVKWIEAGLPNEGKMMVFNNGEDRPTGDYSTVNIWTPPMDGTYNYSINSNEAYGPTIFDREYEGTGFFAERISGAQQLPNANILICVGTEGYFFEITPDDEIVWEYINPSTTNGAVSQGDNPSNNNSTFRATRYDANYPAFIDKDLTPGDPVENDPLPYDCTIYGPVSTTSINALEGVSILENPVNDVLKINNETGQLLTVDVFDHLGRPLLQFDFEGEYFEKTLPELSFGFYLVRFVEQNTGAYYTQRVLLD